MSKSIDKIDRRILEELQNDASQSQRAVAERVGLSQNACWRRIKALEATGVIQRRTVVVDRQKLDIGLVVFAMVRTRHHSADWLRRFRSHVSNIPEVVDFFRIGGDYDYLLKIITTDMHTYDSVYKRLIENVELDTVTSYFSMEAIEEQRTIALT
ncbi:transcriptional regulator, AsnC family [Palleronia marisminoris]|uniref:Leucine-responsive regulatory protein n=1 Tax=Palleronia marisminoris TaxID=315423 RepID=A0A1Y5TWM6_9RHOB|nr:Lrp/AsnC family transcriptional regulator [Palleronia marisminoris]SFH49063.1 transcriptional regulator, AsnC family [Palleronia marisminoris]SLN69831.1 Leucine-responsive regulatory protein [Palleronia marisminoris]